MNVMRNKASIRDQKPDNCCHDKSRHSGNLFFDLYRCILHCQQEESKTPVKTKKGKKSPPVSVCKLCCDNEVASEEIVKCIECKKTAHRYCAGVPIDEMASDSGCYTCTSCVKKLHEKELTDMKACIASLRAEIAELRTAVLEVEAAVAAKDSEAWSVGDAQLEGWSRVTRSRRKDKQSNSMKSSTAESGREQPNITPTAASFQVDKSHSQQCPTGRSKVEVKGKRKVWGTLKTTTVAAVKNAIKVISKVEGLEIKRKYSLKKAQQARIGREAASTQVSKWWFIISGEESILDQLVSNWDAIKLQTNWSLELIFSYGNPTDQATDQDTNSSCVLNERPCIQLFQSTDDSEISGDGSALQTPTSDPEANGITDLLNETPQEPGASRAPYSTQSD